MQFILSTDGPASTGNATAPYFFPAGSRPAAAHHAVTLTIRYCQPHGRQTLYTRAIPKALQPRYGKRNIKVLIPSQEPAIVAREATRLTREIEAEWAAMREAPTVAPKTIKAQAIAYLAANGLQPLDGLVSPASPDQPPTQQELSIEALEARLTHPDGTPRADQWGPVQQAAVAMLTAEPAATVTDLRDAYVKHHRKASDPAFIKRTAMAFGKLVSLMGDKPIAELGRAEARAFIASATKAGSATTTTRRNINTYSAAWKSYRRELAPELVNPWEALAIPGEGSDKGKRHTFTSPELLTILAACQAKDDSLRWMAAMLMDTGARIVPRG